MADKVREMKLDVQQAKRRAAEENKHQQAQAQPRTRPAQEEDDPALDQLRQIEMAMAICDLYVWHQVFLSANLLPFYSFLRPCRGQEFQGQY